MESDAANAPRSRARSGTYEAWYLSVADPTRRQGYWIRYTSFNPARRGAEDEAHSALWAFRFDHDDPSANWGAKETFPRAALNVQARPFVLRLGAALLAHDGCTGDVHSDRGTMSWDLRWDSRERPFHFVRPPWEGISSVANIASQPAIKVSGTMECSDGAVLHEWCLEGYGLAWRSWWEVGDDIVKGRLISVLDAFAAPPIGIHAVFPQRRHLPLRVRLFLDLLKHTFGAPGYWG